MVRGVEAAGLWCGVHDVAERNRCRAGERERRRGVFGGENAGPVCGPSCVEHEEETR